MINLLPIKAILGNPSKYIAYMCFNTYITVDNQYFNLQFMKLKQQLSGGSYCYKCNGKYRTMKYFDKNKVDVFGLIDM